MDPFDEKIRAERSNSKFKTYFYGPNSDIIRTKIALSMTEIKIYKISSTISDFLCELSKFYLENIAAREYLPAHTTLDTELRLTQVKPDKFKKIIFAVSSLTKKLNQEPSLEELISYPIAFLIYVTNVDIEKNTMEILYPVSDDLLKVHTYWIFSEISSDI